MAALVEPISLSIGAVALASLFTTCLDCLDMIDAGRNFSRDLEIALAKLEAQRAIFLVWGNTIGLDNGGRHFDEELLGPGIQMTMKRLLCCIVSLFEDSKKFRKRYGLKKATALEITCASEHTSTGLETYRSRVRLFQKQASFTTKFRWAVHDRKRFTALITDLKDLIDQLRDVTSSIADLGRQRQVLVAEISSMSDTHSLDVLEEALRDDDPELSEVASQRIVQLTEAGTNAEYLLLESESQYVTAYSGIRVQSPLQNAMTIDDLVEEPEMEVSDDDMPGSEVVTLEPLDALEQTVEGHLQLVYGQQNNLKVIHERNEATFKMTTRGSGREDRWAHHQILDVLKDRENTLITLGPEGGNLRTLLAAVQGPSGTPYEGGVFFIRIEIPKGAPLVPPICRFLTPVLHPNVASNGTIVLDILTTWDEEHVRRWNPVWSLGKLLQAILSLLCDPDWFNAVSPEISHWYGSNPYAFEAQSRILTQRYAQRTMPMGREYSDVYFEILEQLEIHHPEHDRLLQKAAFRRAQLEEIRVQEVKYDREGEMLLFVGLVLCFALFFVIHIFLIEPSRL